MIEMVYKGKDGNGKEEKKLPKNVRQIGEAGKGKKIYLEDYAVTYIHQTAAAVLLGETWEKDGSKYIFIHGAVQVDDPSFEEDVWGKVYREVREYFADSEILGWAMQVQELPEASDPEINRIFKSHFDREDTVLLLYEEAEKEDTVFAEENGALKKLGGYFVYYDKNKSMQDYMVHKNEGKSVEKEEDVSDQAIKSFRKRAEEKKDRPQKEKETAKQPKNTRFLYAASTFLVLTIMVIAVTMISNYDKMKNMEQALANMAKQTEAAAVNAPVQEESQETESETEKETAGGMESAMNIPEEGMQPGGNLSALSEAKQEGETAADPGAAAQAAATGADAQQAEALPAPDVSGQDEGTKEAASGGVRPQQAFYTVKDGDTLMDICRMYYGTDEKLEALCSFNGITDPNSIVPGQKIKLP